ncbi:MAG: class I SAM-dependent methyltransferase [Mycobacteriales bacterium]
MSSPTGSTRLFGLDRRRQLRWAKLRLLDRVVLRRSDDILLVAENELMADYVLRVWGALESLGIGGAVTSPDHLMDAVAAKVGTRQLRLVPWRKAQRRHWRCIVLGNHLPLTFLPSDPRVLVNHGLTTDARAVRGNSYRFDRARLYLPDGRPVYRLLLDAGYRSRDRGVAADPGLAGRIAVVGDLRVDELEKHARAQPDPTLQWPSGAGPLVAIMSTWGPHGVLESLGPSLLDEIVRLGEQGSARFLLFSHPNLWYRTDTRYGWPALLNALEQRCAAIRVVRPEEDWAPVLAHAELAVVDQTSLAASFAVLGRPMIPLASAETLVPGGFAATVIRRGSPLAAAHELGPAVAHAVRDNGPERYADLAAALVDHRGEAASRIRTVFAELLTTRDAERPQSRDATATVQHGPVSAISLALGGRMPNPLSKLKQAHREVLGHMYDAQAQGVLAPLATAYVPWSPASLRPSAVVSVLNEVTVRRRKLIVELGAGISTLFLGRLLRSSGGQLISVEHDEQWLDVMASLLAAEGLADVVTLLHAPLRDYDSPWGTVSWYEPATVTSMLSPSTVDLLLVDGPVAGKRAHAHSRYPALPVLRPFLTEDASIVLDDISRPGEEQVCARWERDFGLAFTRHPVRGNLAIAQRGRLWTI